MHQISYDSSRTAKLILRNDSEKKCIHQTLDHSIPARDPPMPTARVRTGTTWIGFSTKSQTRMVWFKEPVPTDTASSQRSSVATIGVDQQPL